MDPDTIQNNVKSYKSTLISYLRRTPTRTSKTVSAATSALKPDGFAALVAAKTVLLVLVGFLRRELISVLL